jgi:tetratricopeptide (TPR) repeat protein
VAEIEIPEELEELLEETSTFRRRMAVIVVLVTLFGVIIAYLHDVESNFEDNAAQEAARASVDGLGSQNAASNQTSLQLGHVIQQEAIDAARRAATSAELKQLPGSAAESQALGDAARYKAIQDALAKEQDKAGSLDEVNGLVAGQQQAAFKQQLVNTVRSQQSNDHGNKANAYVAVLAVVAVGLFLIGLSLTIEAKGRYYLAVPGVVVVVVCMLWSLTIAQRGALQVSSKAIDTAAAGEALIFQGKFQQAKDSLDQAIADSPNFADAYLARAEAETGLGNQTPELNIDAVVDPKLAKAAADDSEKAIALGKGSDVDTVTEASFTQFLVGNDKRSEELSRQLTTLSPTNPLGFLNLGVSLAAQGKAKQANAAYDSALNLIERIGQGDDVTARFILASARSDLETATAHKGADADLITAIKGRLTDKGFSLDPGTKSDAQVSGNPSIDGDVTVKANGALLSSTFQPKGMAAGDALTTVMYFRRAGAAGDEPFVALPFLDFNSTLTQGEIDNGFLLTSPSPTACLQPGTYRVEVYSGDKFLKDGSVDVAQGPFGDLKPQATDVSDTSVCRPDAWSTHSLNNTLAGGTDPVGQGVAYHDPNTGANLIVRLYRPFAQDAGLASNDLLDSIIDFAGTTDVNTTLTSGKLGNPAKGTPQLVTLTGDAGTSGAQVCLPSRTADGTAKLKDDGTAEKTRVIAVQGSDQVLRVVILAAPDQQTVDDMTDELVPRVDFTNTGTSDTNSVTCPG